MLNKSCLRKMKCLSRALLEFFKIVDAEDFFKGFRCNIPSDLPARKFKKVKEAS